MQRADGNQPSSMETSNQSSLDMDLVSQVMYIQYGEVNPGDEAKVGRLESKMSDWKRDVKGDSKNFTRDEISSDLHEVEKNFDGYWCKGVKCACKRTHWVIRESETNCWDCMHDPCACNPPLEWDEAEKAYFRFFLSCDGKTKTNIWMTRPTSDLETINYKRGEKKRKDRRKKEDEEENCAKDQECAKNHGYCCHQHAKVAKKQHEKYKKQVSRQKETAKEFVVESEQCIHCDKDPCVFTQIEMRLCENDEIYYDGADYEKAPVADNSSRRKRAFQYAAFILWEGVNYRRQHYKCVEDGVRSLFPPLDGKTMGYKEE
jgi:hypothetical protein